jgi:cyanophycinase
MQRTVPKGRMLIIGGGEDKGAGDRPDIESRNIDFKPYEILRELIDNGKSHRIVEIINTASESPDEINKMYEKAFQKLGFKDVGFVTIKNKEDARTEKFVKRIRKAHAVLLSGGNQMRLSTILGGSPVSIAIEEKYCLDKNFILAGTSAGAMVLAETMIIEGDTDEALLKGSVRLSAGLGYIAGCIIDTHLVKRGRFGRLTEAVIMNPTSIGIGLGEDTALIIKNGRIAECKGSGMVTLIDGHEIGHTNIPYAEKDTPICAERVIVHILSRGSGFNLETKEFLPSKKDMRVENTTKKKKHKKPKKRKKLR